MPNRGINIFPNGCTTVGFVTPVFYFGLGRLDIYVVSHLVHIKPFHSSVFGVWGDFSPKIVCHRKMNKITKQVVLRFEPIPAGGINTTYVSHCKFNRIYNQCMAQAIISQSTLIKYFN